MSTLAAQRCSIHEGREAAARCPACKGYFCRECVTEHAGRMICARCVAREKDQEIAAKQERFGWLRYSAWTVGGLLLTWLVFYYAGVGLANLPSTFHGGSL